MPVTNLVRRPASAKARSEAIAGYSFVFPLVALLLLFVIGPIFYTLYASFTKWDGISRPVFNGLQNYRKLLGDSVIGREFWNTIFYTFVNVPIKIFLAILLANAFNKGVKGKGIFQVAYFTPTIALPVATVLVFQALFHSKYGAVNEVLGFLRFPQPRWLAEPRLVMWVIVIMVVWAGVGYNAIILYSGLKGIPKSFYEACDMDGASEFQKFFHITLPLLTPQVFYVTTVSIIGSMKMFDQVYLFAKETPLTEAGIRNMAYGIYQRGFIFFEMGYASAESMLLFALIMVITLLQFYGQKWWVHYE
jgi:multiple sugar transport system permease protein